MLTTTLRRLTLGIALALLPANWCLSAETTGASKAVAVAAVKEWENPANALDTLQSAFAADSNALLVQKDLDFLIAADGGGACASAAGINLLQTLRVMNGLEKLPNLHRVALGAFARQPDLLGGGKGVRNLF